MGSWHSVTSGNHPNSEATKNKSMLTPERLRGFARVLPVLVPLLLLAGTGMWGVDYGSYWDEKNHLRAMGHAIDTGVLLPSFYHYPSVTFYQYGISIVPR